MSEQSAPVPDDERTHAEAPAEGDSSDVETDTPREHTTEPAEGA